MSTKGGFFAVGRETLIKACELGINPGAAFLVMARGTGGDNVTTKWSAEAVSRRLGIRWTAAKEAIEKLKVNGITPRVEGGAITYKLDKSGDLIWLPNEVVDGAASELAPVLKLRQTQDAMVLRLFGELYVEQNLREDGGVSRSLVERRYTRERIGQRGANVVWYFKHENTYVTWGHATTPHRAELTRKDEKEGKSRATKFFKRLEILESAGLVEWVPYLFEGPQGEPIHPLAWNGMPMEQALYNACVTAGRSLLTDTQKDWLDTNRDGGWLVAAPAHIAEVTMFGIVRLRYRPHTRMTAAWWADYNDRCAKFTEAYDAISGRESRVA